MTLPKFSLLSLAATLAILTSSAFASPVGVDGKFGSEWAGITPVTIAANPGAPTSNFSSPSATATVGYNIYTRDDGNFFYVLLTTTDTSALPFANLYFDTIASTPGTGSNLGFEVTNNQAFIPGKGGVFTPSSSDFSFATTNDMGTLGITAAISNTFFLTDPLGMGFAKTPDGTLVSLHLSQSFGYSVVGGSANFPPPVELGDALVGSATSVPEPATLSLIATGLLGAASAIRRRLRI